MCLHMHFILEHEQLQVGHTFATDSTCFRDT